MKKLQRFFLWLIALSILIMPFKVMGEEEPEAYTLYDAGSGYEEKTQSEEDAFALFEENAADYDNLVLKREDTIIKMEYGIIAFQSDSACSLLIEYDSLKRDEKDSINGCYGIDALYLDSDEEGKVRFLLNGDLGETDIENVTLHPINEIKTRISSYSVKEGKLIHNIKTQLEYDFYSYSIPLDEKADYMDEGVTYYSYDGHFFYDDFFAMSDDVRQGNHENAINEEAYYNYFKYLPHRSYSEYGVQEVKDYFYKTLSFDGRLQHYEDLDGDNAADEINRSQLYGVIEEFFATQSLYGANAMMLLSSAIYESSYGKSLNSFAANNLYLASAFETDEERDNNRYDSISDSIYARGKYLISRHYANHLRNDYRGTFYGDRLGGINVTYSIDPYYGEKSAARYFELDQKLSGKDKDKYALAILKDLDWVNFYGDENLERRLFSLYDISELSFIVLAEYEDAYKIRIDRTSSDEYFYDPEDSVAYITKDRVYYLVNPEKIEEESFIRKSVDLDGGSVHGLDDLDLILKEETIPLLPEKEGFVFSGFDENDQATYRKIASIDLNGSFRKDLLPGSEIDLRDCKLKVVYENGGQELIDLNSDMISGYDKNSLENTVVISYGGLSMEEDLKYSEKASEKQEQLKQALSENDASAVKKLIDEVSYPFTFSDIRTLDYELMNKNERNYVIFDKTERYNLSISGLDLSLDDKRSLSLYGDTYYVIVEDINPEAKERIYDVAKGYGFSMLEGIDISFRFNYQSIGLKGPAIVQLDIGDKRNDLVYSVYHLSEEGDVIKCRTTQSDNYIQFMINASGSYLVMSLPSVNEFDIKDKIEDLSYENMGYDKHKTNFELMGTIVISLIGIIGITVYYIVYNKRKRLWKDFRRSLRQAAIVQEEKPKS